MSLLVFSGEADAPRKLPVSTHCAHLSILPIDMFHSFARVLLGNGMDYIYDHFKWDHCEKDDTSGEEAFSTGYTDGVTSESDSSDTEPKITSEKPFTFTGGVNPGSWQGETFKSLRPGNIMKSDSIDSYRAAVKKFMADGKVVPGKNLQSHHALKAKYTEVMDILEKTSK
jgi:hypothetical protein